VPSRRSTPLDRETVVRTALTLIDRDGLQALSMRRLARELGVEAMSLYYHVRNKEDLLDACIEEVSASMDLSGMHARGPWRERLKAGLGAYRALAQAHPQLFALVGHRPVRRLEVLRPVEVALGVLADAGFTAAQSMRAFRIINSFVYGYALSELTGLAVQTASDVTVADDPDDFPNLTHALPIARNADPDVEFERGLDTILDGIVAWQPASR
jgi:TetR/AcrR family tetracycline transcriptional repressor